MSKRFLILSLLVLTILLIPPFTAAAADKPVSKRVAQKVEYTLPYPGILPDHPLYCLKGVRDYILDKLIVDPVRKIEFYILQADKRLGMGISLVDKGKKVLAEEVISKGEKYMDKAVGGLITSRREGKEVPGYVTDRLEKSMLKHIEALEELIVRSEGEYKKGLMGSLDLVRRLQQELAKVK